MFAKGLDELVDALVEAELENAETLYGKESFEKLCSVLKEELAEAGTEFAHLRDAAGWQQHKTNLGIMLCITKQAVKELVQVAAAITRCAEALDDEEQTGDGMAENEEPPAGEENTGCEEITESE